MKKKQIKKRLRELIKKYDEQSKAWTRKADAENELMYIGESIVLDHLVIPDLEKLLDEMEEVEVCEIPF